MAHQHPHFSGWFRLTVGMHIQQDFEAEPDGGGAYPERVYQAGEVFPSTADLCAQNGRGMSPKFERVDQGVARAYRDASRDYQTRVELGREPQSPGSTQPLPTNPALPPHGAAARDLEKEYSVNFDKMEVKDLQGLAAEEGVDLKGATKKADIVKAMREPR